MSPLSIVEELEILEQFSARRGACCPSGVVNEFDLERGKEALGDGVVPAIAPAAHAADDPVLRQDPLVVGTGVLTATIRMMQQALGRAPRRQRHAEGVERQSNREALGTGPAPAAAR